MWYTGFDDVVRARAGRDAKHIVFLGCYNEPAEDEELTFMPPVMVLPCESR